MSDEMIKFKSSGLGSDVCGHDSVMECNEFMQDQQELPDQPANDFELDSFVKEKAFSSGGICCEKESGLYYFFSGMKFGDFSTVEEIKFKPATPEEAAKAPAEAGDPDMEFTPEEAEAAPAAETKPPVEKPVVTEVKSEDALYDTLKALGEGEYAIVNFSKPKHKGCRKYERAFRRMAKKHNDKATFVFVGESNSDAWSGFRGKLGIKKKAPAVFAMDREGNCYEVTRIYKPLRTIRMLEKGKQTTGIIAKIEIPADEPVEEVIEIPLEPIKPEEPSFIDEALGTIKKVDPIDAIIVLGGVAVVTAIVVFRNRVVNLARTVGSGMAAAKDNAVAKLKSIAGERKASAPDKAAAKQAAADAKAAKKKATADAKAAKKQVAADAKAAKKQVAADAKAAGVKAAEQKPTAEPAEPKRDPTWLEGMKAEAEAAAQAAEEAEAESEKNAAKDKKAAKKAAAEAKKKAAAEKKQKIADKKAIVKAQKEHTALLKSYAQKKVALDKVIDPALKLRMIAKEQMIVELNIHEQVKGEAWYINLNPDQRVEVISKIAEGEKNIGVKGIEKITYLPKTPLGMEGIASDKCQIIAMLDESVATIVYEKDGGAVNIALERGLTPKQQKLFKAEYDAIIKQIKALPLEVRVGFLELDIDADGLARRLVMQKHVTSGAEWKLITGPFGKGKGVFKNYPPKFIESRMEASKLMADPLPDLDLNRDAIPNLKKYLPSTLELKQAEKAQKEKVEAEAKAKTEAEAKAKAEAEQKAADQKAKQEAAAKKKAELDEAKAEKKAEAENKKRLAQFKKDQTAKKKDAQAWIAEIDKIKDPELKARMEGIEFIKRELLVHEYLKDVPWYQELQPNERVATITAIVEGTDSLVVGEKEMKVSFESVVYDKPITENGKVVNEELVAIIREGDAEGAQETRIPIEREISAKDAKAFAKEYDVLVEQVLSVDKEIKVTFLDRDITTDTVVSRLIMRKHVMSDMEWDGYTKAMQVKGAKGIDAVYPKALIDSAAKNIEGYANPIGEMAKTLVTLPKMGRKNAVIMGPAEAAEIVAEAGVEGAPKKPGPPPPPPAAMGKKPSSTPPPPPAAAKKGNGKPPPPPPTKKGTGKIPPPPGKKVIVDPSIQLDLGGVSDSTIDLGPTDLDKILLEERVCVDPGNGEAGKPPPMPIDKSAEQIASQPALDDAVTMVPPPPPSSETAALAEWEKFEKLPYFEGLDSVMKSDLAQYKAEFGKVILQHKADPTFAKDSKMMAGEMITLEGFDYILSRNFGVSIKGVTKAASAKPATKGGSKKSDGAGKAKDGKDKVIDAAKKK